MSTPVASPRFWSRLLSLIDEQQVVPVVGPDLLKIPVNGASVPLYDWLALELARQLDVSLEGIGRPPTLNDVACRYIERREPLDDVYITLKSIMDTLTLPALPDALLKLVRIPRFKLFVSTTFDSLIDQAVNQVRRANRTPAHSLVYSLNSDFDDLPDALANLDRPVVYHLMGRVSAIKQSYAVTDEDLLEFVHTLQVDDRRPKRLFDALSERNLLIIGNAFSGWLTRFFLRTLKDKQRLWSVRDRAGFFADSGDSADVELQSFLSHFSEQTLTYPGSAEGFVDELLAQWQARHPGGVEETEALRPPEPNAMPRHAVFLSYASEDRATVLQLKNALDEAGIDVWFDRDELSAGEVWERKIKANIDIAAAFVPVISQSVIRPRAREFRVEWEYALEVRKRLPRDPGGGPAKFILPLVIDGTDMQSDAVRPYFGDLQAQYLTEGKPTTELRAALKLLVRGAQTS